ncbi:MAG: glutamate synthase-related protein [Nitrososphaerota archaeon]
MSEVSEFGRALLGGPVYEKGPLRFDVLSKILVVPPLYTPRRLKKMEELMREPLFKDVDTERVVGGFRSKIPVAVASMGSTDVFNRVSLECARAAARAGVPMGVGENVATVWGYGRRLRSNQPCFKERVMTYLENCDGGFGGIFIQQSVEDAYDELWNRVYSDPDITPYLEKGMIAFDIKLGQGAKPGLGGETFVDRLQARRLHKKYGFDSNPETVAKPYYERHSVPGTFTPEILSSMIRLMKNNYPKARVWIKCGPYRDLDEVLHHSSKEGVDAFWIDGKEGGTGLSPVTALKDLGLPLLACLQRVRKLRMDGLETDVVCSGRIVDGGDVVKVLALGATAAGLGRPIVIAAYSGGAAGVERYLETISLEIQLLTSAVGKYDVSELAPEDMMAVDRGLGASLGISSIYD